MAAGSAGNGTGTGAGNGTRKAKKSVGFRPSQVLNLNPVTGTFKQYEVPTHTFNGKGDVPSSEVQAEQKKNPGAFNPVKSFNKTTYRSLTNKENQASRASFLRVKGLYGDRWVNATVAIDTYKEEKKELEKGYDSKFRELFAAQFGTNMEQSEESKFMKTIEEINEASRDVAEEVAGAEEELNLLFLYVAENFEFEDFAEKYKPFHVLYFENLELRHAAKKEFKRKIASLRAAAKKRGSTTAASEGGLRSRRRRR